jgi:urea transporter
MGGFSSFFTAGIGAVLVKHYRTPSFTLPFNICLMLMLGAVAPGDLTHFPASVFPGVHKDAARGAALELTHLSVLDGLAAIPKGVGQIFFADKLGPCLIITLAILPCSLIGLVAACLGSAVGVCMALFYGASPAAIAIGLWGYNGVLGAIAIFGMFFVPTARSLVMSIACAALSTSLFAAIRVWLGNVFLPAGTFGFCFATILICLMRDDIPHLLTVPLHKVSTPEHHLIDAKRKRDRRREREREGK